MDRPMLSDRCLSVLTVFSVSSCAVCNIGVLWQRIKMKLGVEVGLGSDHLVLDGDPAPPPQKGHSPQLLAHVHCGQMAGWIKMPLGTEVGLGQGDIVLDGDPGRSPHKKGGTAPPNFWSMFMVVKRLNGLGCYLVWR